MSNPAFASLQTAKNYLMASGRLSSSMKFKATTLTTCSSICMSVGGQRRKIHPDQVVEQC
jgi:hypothetical protein